MRARAQSGFILVAALWLLAALAAFAAIYAVYAGDAVMAGALHEDAVRFDAAELSALELTALQLGAGRSPQPASGAMRLTLDGAEIDVAWLSEAARVDLNGAPKEMLAALFSSLGATPADASAYASHVDAWRQSGPAEADAYRAAGLPYPPRGSLFQDVRELSLVRDLPPALVKAALPYLTIFNPSGQIDARVAPPLVLATLPGLEPNMLPRLAEARSRPGFNAEAELERLGRARMWATASPSAATRVRVVTTLRNGRRRIAEMVIAATPSDSAPYRVLAWADR